jgi:hypothetical protein
MSKTINVVTLARPRSAGPQMPTPCIRSSCAGAGSMLAPPHSLQLLLWRWCWQMPDPPHSLHSLLLRWCWQMRATPHKHASFDGPPASQSAAFDVTVSTRSCATLAPVKGVGDTVTTCVP